MGKRYTEIKMLEQLKESLRKKKTVIPLTLAGAILSNGFTPTFADVEADVKNQMDKINETNDALLPGQVYEVENLEQSNWAYEIIHILVNEGILERKHLVKNGETNTMPEGNCPRGYSMYALCRAMGIEPYDYKELDKTNYEDLFLGLFETYYVQKLSDENLINGIGNGLFGTYENITRQDYATVIYRILKAKGYKFESDANVDFKDFNKIPNYAQEAVKTLAAEGIFNGYPDGTFGGEDPLTYEQVFALAFRIAQINGMDFKDVLIKRGYETTEWKPAFFGRYVYEKLPTDGITFKLLDVHQIGTGEYEEITKELEAELRNNNDDWRQSYKKPAEFDAKGRKIRIFDTPVSTKNPLTGDDITLYLYKEKQKMKDAYLYKYAEIVKKDKTKDDVMTKVLEPSKSTTANLNN